MRTIVHCSRVVFDCACWVQRIVHIIAYLPFQCSNSCWHRHKSLVFFSSFLAFVPSAFYDQKRLIIHCLIKFKPRSVDIAKPTTNECFLWPQTVCSGHGHSGRKMCNQSIDAASKASRRKYYKNFNSRSSEFNRISSVNSTTNANAVRQKPAHFMNSGARD